MKRRFMELTMAFLLFICFFFLSREAAEASRTITGKEENKKIIVIDPGHGGEDPGMVGVGNLKEKGVNLEIAKKLRDILEKDGFRIVMTREEDKGLYDENSHNKKAQDMQRRIAIIDENSPILTISIHQNSYQDSSVRGPQVFYYQDSAEGEKLASALQDSLNAGLSVERPRTAKGNRSYYLLKRSEGVLVIAECGFLTNPEEAALLQTDGYQNQVASALAQGILNYLES